MAGERPPPYRPNRGGCTWQDVLKIMRHFDTRKDGQVSYNEFCDALLPGENSGGINFLKSTDTLVIVNITSEGHQILETYSTF